MRKTTVTRCVTALATWIVMAGLLLSAATQRSFAVAWNATDPTFSAVSTGGLTDNYGQFTNESYIQNNDISARGTCTYLNNGWFLTALHVVSTSTYGVLAPTNDILINVYGTNYTADQYYTWGSADVAMVHVAGYTSGTLTTLTGVEKRQVAGPGNGLAQIGGFGLWGPLDSTMNSSIAFHRAFNTPSVSGPFLYINTNPNSRLINDGYVLGLDQPGDSGSGMWEDNGPSDQDLNLWDWSLTGVTQTGGAATFYSSGGYGFLQSYSAGLWSTAYPHAVLTWNANSGAGATAVDGSGTWDLSTANFTDGTNYAFNGPERTEQAIFGAGNGTAGTVTLGATVPVDQIIFNAAGSGTFTIAGSGANVITLGAGTIITTNVNATISANMTGGTSSQHGAVFQFIKNGNATLTLTGTTTLLSGVAFHARAGTTVIDSGGNFNSGYYTSVAVYSNESATVTVKGSGVFNGPGQDFNLGDLGGSGVLNVQDSAAVNIGQLYVGKGSTGDTGAGGTGIVNQTGGTVSASGFVSLGTVNSASAGTYNLAGGVLRTAAVDGGAGQSTFNFNGGTLQATASSGNFMSGLTNAVVGTGGAVIDTNGNNVVLSQVLTGGAGDGGLTKLGAGALVFTSSHGYTGPTAITAGTLQMGNGGAAGWLPLGSAIVNNGTLAFNRGNNVTQGTDFSSAPITGTGSLAQLGAGTLTLAGSNSYTGGTTVTQGTLLLTGSLNPNGGLGVAGGTFIYSPSGAAMQSFNGLTVNVGAATVSNATAGSTLALGAITQNVGGTVDFLATAGSVNTTNVNVNGLLGPWAFVGTGSNSAYATLTGGNIGAYTGAIVESNSASSWGGIPSGTGGTLNYIVSANGNFPQTGLARNVNTMQYTGSGGTQTSNSSSVLLVANGIINTGTGPLVIGGGANALNVQIGTNKELVIGAFTGGIAINNSLVDSAVAGGALTKTGAGILTLGGSNNYTGGTYLDAGSTSISANNNLGGTGGTAGAVTLDGGMLTTTARITNTHPFLIGASGGTINVASAAGTQYYFHTANTLLGSGPLTLTGTGTLTAFMGNLRVDQANSYSGNLTVQSGGIFEYGAAGAVSSSATFTIGNQGEVAVQTGVTLPNSVTVGAPSGSGTNSVLSFENGNGGVFSGPITLNANATVGLRDWYNNADVRQGTITGQITGAGGLTINSGSGTGGALALGDGANNYAGGTSVTNATLLIGSPTIGGLGTTTASEAGALGSGSLTVNGGGIAQLGYRSQNISASAPQSVPNNITLNGGGIYGNDNYQHLSGAINVTAASGTLGSTFSGASGNLNKGLFVDGPVSGGGNLTIVQAGAYELNGWGNEQGNSYNVGITMFSSAANSYSGTVTVLPYNAGGGNYLAVNNSTALQNATISLTADNTGSTQLYGASTLLFQTGLGAATIGALSGSGDVALTGMNEQTAVSGGDAIALTVGGNGASTTYSGIMSGAGSLTKIGAGTTLLSNSNTYAGTTNVNAGTLRLGVDQALPSTTVLTLNGGSLDLNGHSNSISQLIVNSAAMSQSVGAVTVTTAADGAVQLGGAVGSTGSYTMSGGSLNVTAGPMDVGWYGNGTFDQTGGLVTTNNYLILGRQTGSTGVYNISGGTVTNTGSLFAVGQQGRGTLSVSGSGVVVAGGAGLSVGGLFGGGGNGSVNLSSGGRIQTAAVSTGGGISTFNFNGGTLQAAAGASGNFFAGLTNVVSRTAGATIDSNGNNVSFASSVSGSGGLTKAGGGTMIVQSNNTYAGPTVISGGVLQLGSITPQLDYDFTSGSAVNNGNNSSAVTSTPVGSPVISATGGPNGLGMMTLNGANYLAITAASLPNLSGSASYTIGMWIDTTQAGGSVLYKGTTGAWTSGDENFYLTSGTPNSNNGGTGTHVGGVQWGGGFIGGKTAVNTGTWEFISIVRNGAESTVYVNGVNDGTTINGMSNPEQGTQLIALGYNSGVAHDGALMFSGSISGSYVYGSALTQAQIQSLMNAGPTGVYGNLPATTALSITSSGAALDLDGASQTVASLSGIAGSSVYLGGGTLTVAGSGSTTFAGNISDSGGASSAIGGQLVLNGPETLLLSGTDTYNGGTFVGNGTLIVGNPAAIADETNLTAGNALFFSSAPVVPALEPAAAAAVPEPGTLGILAIGAIAIVWGRRRAESDRRQPFETAP